MELFLQTLTYVSQAPYFWLTVGATVSTFMFIGAIVFDGDLSVASKAMICMVAYVFFLAQAQIVRINDAILDQTLIHSPKYMAHAGTVTILLFSLLCFFGILLGVFISLLVHKHHK